VREPPRLTLPSTSDPELAYLLRELQLVLLKYPRAAQAAVRALTAEGRRFAATEEGRRWRERLAGSSLVRHGQVLWNGTALDLFDAQEDRVLPSAYLDAIIGALASGDLQNLLRSAAVLGDDDGADDNA
jgi:hypothetical protein